MEFFHALGILSMYFVILYIIYKILDYIYRYPYVSDRKNKWVLITGCDSGFGFQAAQRFDRDGINVLACCLTSKGKDEIEQVCSKKIKTYILDISNAKNVKETAEMVKKEIPRGQGLWGLINNAGIQGKVAPEDWLHVKDYQETINVNLYGAINMCMEMLPLLKQARGRIVNTSSVAGRMSAPYASVYCVSKYALECYSDGLRRMLKPYGVSVSLIEPQAFRTNIITTYSGNIKRAWTECPQQVKHQYGTKGYLTLLKNMTEGGKSKLVSDNVYKVIDSYEHALLALHPRPRYMVGIQTKVFWSYFVNFPEWLQDWLLGKIFFSITEPDGSPLKED